VLRAAGFLDGDEPTDLGRLAGSLYGESSLLVADAIASGLLDGLKPEELAATLVSLVAEDRGRERPQPSRRHFPTPRIEERHRRLRTAMRRFVELEREHGLETMPPLSLEQIRPAYEWASGVPLADIEPPPGADTGDVVKAVKSLYSLLRQMEQALRGHALHPVVALTRERVERDLIRRI
jgi:ATP-dependent RNA helicase HelY